MSAGKAFFRKKKQPIPVDLRRKDWGDQVEKALNATYLFQGHGSCLTIRRVHLLEARPNDECHCAGLECARPNCGGPKLGRRPMLM